MSTLVTHRPPIVRLLLLGVLASASCRDPAPVPTDGCFTLDPWKDERDAAAEYAMSEGFRPDEYDRMLRAIGFCEYGPDEIDDIFPEHSRSEIDTWSACIDAAACDQCVGEEIDEQIRHAYDEFLESRGCPADGRAILAYERGCVSSQTGAEGEPMCCYSAALVSECPWRELPPH